MTTDDKPQDAGASVSPTGLSQAEPEVSALRASIPRAAEDRIISAVKRALEPLNNPSLNWQEYHRRLLKTPELVLHAIRESNVLFRLPEQANWPLLIEAFSQRPYTLTIRTQMTIGGQTFGFDQQQDDRLLYGSVALDRDLAMHLSRRAIRATLEAVAQPFYGQAAVQFASAIEARRAATGNTDAVHESAAPQEGAHD